MLLLIRKESKEKSQPNKDLCVDRESVALVAQPRHSSPSLPVFEICGTPFLVVGSYWHFLVMSRHVLCMENFVDREAFICSSCAQQTPSHGMQCNVPSRILHKTQERRHQIQSKKRLEKIISRTATSSTYIGQLLVPGIGIRKPRRAQLLHVDTSRDMRNRPLDKMPKKNYSARELSPRRGKMPVAILSCLFLIVEDVNGI